MVFPYRLYNSRTTRTFSVQGEQSLENLEVERLRSQDAKVPELEQKLKELEDSLQSQRVEGKAQNERYSRELELQNRQRQELQQNIIRAVDGLYRSAGLTKENPSDNPQVHLDYLAGEIGRIRDGGVTLPGILNNLGAIRSVTSVAHQKRNHPDYRRLSLKEYTSALAANTDFSNPNSVHASAGFLAEDLMHVHNLDTLTEIASDGRIRQIFEAYGTGAMDATFQRISRGRLGEEGTYRAAFAESFALFLSNGLKSRIAQARMLSLDESSYDHLPDAILKSRGVMGTEELKGAIKTTLVRGLYANDPNKVIALLNHEAIARGIGDDYRTPSLFSDAINQMDMHVKEPSGRIGLYEKILIAANQQKVPTRLEDRQLMTRSYIRDVIDANDLQRLEHAAKIPFIRQHITDDEILATAALYLANTQSPRTSAQSRFGVELLGRYEIELKQNLGFGPNTFAETFGRHSASLGLDDLIGLRPQQIYNNNPAIRENVDARIDNELSSYFSRPQGLSPQDGQRLSGIIANAAELPESSRNILLAGALNSQDLGSLRTRYIEQLCEHLPQEQKLRIFDDAASQGFARLFEESAWRFNDGMPKILGILHEKEAYAGSQGTSSLLKEILLSAQNLENPSYSARALGMLANDPVLRAHLTDEIKDGVFASYAASLTAAIEQTIAHPPNDGGKKLADQNRVLSAFIKDNAYLFPAATVEKIVDCYLVARLRGTDAPSLHPNLNTLFESINLEQGQVGAIVAGGIERMLFDEQRQRVRPLDVQSQNSHLDLLLRFKDKMPQDQIPKLINYSLTSMDSSPNMDSGNLYGALRKIDQGGAANHVEESMRDHIYQRFLDNSREQVGFYNRDINGAIQLGITSGNLARESRDKSYDGIRLEMQSLSRFVQNEGERLSPNRLAQALDLSLSAVHGRGDDCAIGILQYLQSSQNTAVQDALNGVFIGRIGLTSESFQRTLAGTYMDKFESYLPKRTMDELRRF